MPRRQPTKSWQELRELTEKWLWVDPVTGVRTTGYNPPEKADGKMQKPFFIRYLTMRGVVECGNCICLKVFLEKHQRLIRFLESGETRRICDILVMEVDGIRIVCE